ncbi:hypothetical protein MRB53_026555 [Persea americana]|uniref:Uncharacterized protein n=1 Tax=Persea americana TaxID=3435 RepID=A0ACC2LII7_PERAE|nr:hypothetical protein MRB53_026555 [Persea americana]
MNVKEIDKFDVKDIERNVSPHTQKKIKCLLPLSPASLLLVANDTPRHGGPSQWSLTQPSDGTIVYELLPKYGLLRGLLPDFVTSFSLSDNGSFVIDL